MTSSRNDVCGLVLAEPQDLSRRELWEVQTQWRRVYAGALHSKTGTWLHRGYDWHVFSYAFRECVSGTEAVRELRSKAPTWVVVFSDAGNLREWGVVGDLISAPSIGSREDVIVAGEDLGWTFAATHERDIGPYFSRREWGPLSGGF